MGPRTVHREQAPGGTTEGTRELATVPGKGQESKSPLEAIRNT